MTVCLCLNSLRYSYYIIFINYIYHRHFKIKYLSGTCNELNVNKLLHKMHFKTHIFTNVFSFLRLSSFALIQKINLYLTWGKTFYSLLNTFYSLIVTFTRYSLHFFFCFLFFYSLLVSVCSSLVTFYLLNVTFHLLLVIFHLLLLFALYLVIFTHVFCS